MFKQHITSQLEQRKQAGLLRSLISAESTGKYIVVEGKQYLNFAGNDYLGLATNSDVQSASLHRAAGATASPLVTGRNSIHCQLEQALLDWTQAPSRFACLLYSSGFAANTGVISALFNSKNSDARLVQDKLNHASLMDVGKHVQALGHCKQIRFQHNDISSLQQVFENKCDTDAPKLVVTEGVFSMDGDTADLTKTKALANHNKAWLMLDDAHGIGVTGDKGQGSFAEQGLSLSESDIHVITFGKALGSQGAAVIADRDVIQYLANFSREYIYSTHLSPLQAEATLNNVKVLQQQTWRREKLEQNIHLFRELAKKLPFKLLQSDAAIQPVLVGNETLAMTLSEQLKLNGIWAGAMRYPTVAKGQARLRVTITANHEAKDIEYLVSVLEKLAEEHHA